MVGKLLNSSFLYVRNLFCVVTCLSLISACGTSGKLSHENLSSRFSYGNELLSPQVSLFHKNVDSSEIYFEIPVDGLLYKNNGNEFLAGLSIRWAVYASYTSSMPVDSGSTAFRVISDKEKSAFRNKFSFPLQRKQDYILRLEFEDVNRNVKACRYMQIHREGVLSANDFLLCDTVGVPLYRSHVQLGEIVKLRSNRPEALPFKVRCYYREFPLAFLPFRVIEDPVFEMASDSAYAVDLRMDPVLSFSKEGIYFFQSDTSTAQGFAVFCFEKGFPMVTRPAQLIEATRYLTTKREYEQLKFASDQKSALDKFWLDVGGNYERGRGLIKAYYSRVQEANRLYTSYLEGWKTDRGMMHMIFGKPQSIYRDGETEQWTYNNMPGFPEMLFVFRKMNNPFTVNDYALIRQQSYENVWYIAVDQWRQGRIVNDN